MYITEWSREALLEKWMKDPVECCQLAGVQAPASAFQYSGSVDISCSSPEVPPEEPGSARLEIVVRTLVPYNFTKKNLLISRIFTCSVRFVYAQ